MKLTRLLSLCTCLLPSVQSGHLVLSELIRFLAACLTVSIDQSWQVRPVLSSHAGLISSLLAAKPHNETDQVHFQHPEERNALALFASLLRGSESTSLSVDWARALIQRGADVRARSTDGYTPLQSWCLNEKLDSAAGVLLLLDAGAELDESHSEGMPAWWLLSRISRAQVLRELLMAGRLDVVHISLPGPNKQTLRTCLQHKLATAPHDPNVRELVELLALVQQQWHATTRPLLVSMLSVHEQLVPHLAELIVSFIDGGAAEDVSTIAAAGL